MAIWLDVTTTLGRQRPVSGIYRVEDALIRRSFTTSDIEIRYCLFDKESESYLSLPRDYLKAILEGMDAGIYPELNEILIRLKSSYPYLTSITDKLIDHVIPFIQGDTYISAGLDWDDKDLALIWECKNKLSMKVIQFCYDIIPILFPSLCFSGIPEKFQTYFSDVAWIADCIMCISENTRLDLEGYLKNIGTPLPQMSVVRLGCDINTSYYEEVTEEIKSILKGKFILYVSTIEARKNHQIIYEAYKKLVARGCCDMPIVLFVGMPGWGTENLLSEIKIDADVGKYFRILNHVSDSDLIACYKNSYLTIYPSLYEGWGLPVAESLAYGKFCLASHAASIPEVGGDLIEYADPLNSDDWANRLKSYYENPEEVLRREKAIRKMYVVPTWEEFCDKVFEYPSKMKITHDLDL